MSNAQSCLKAALIFAMLTISNIVVSDLRAEPEAVAGPALTLSEEPEVEVPPGPDFGSQALELVESPRHQLRAIFARRRINWEDGSPITTIFVLEQSSPLHVTFCKRVLGQLPYLLQDRWSTLVYGHGGQKPEVVSSVEAMREALINTPGSIGYLPNPDNEEEILPVRHTP